jgi:hypothetical protein
MQQYRQRNSKYAKKTRRNKHKILTIEPVIAEAEYIEKENH